MRDSADIDSIVCRLAWYFKPYFSQIEAFVFTSRRTWVDAAKVAPHMDSRVARDLEAIKSKVKLLDHAGFAAAIGQLDPSRDILLIWDETAEKNAPAPVQAAIKALSPKQGLYRVDPLRTRMEGSFYLWAGLNRYADREALLQQNHARMRRMVDEIGPHEKAYVFGSGPTLSDFVEGHDFSDGVCVISNSIVKNPDILAATRPRVITAADPLYHAGCSSYAGAFRDELIHAMRTTGAWFVCPMRDFAIYDTFLPSDLRPRIIGVPFNRHGPPPTNLVDTFYLKPYPNVLTLALLPIASTIARKIEIVGCDGRILTDDSFFWSHDKKAQFNDKMSEIQAVHPAFFAIDYNDYYTDHCRNVEEVLATLEIANKRIETVTPSMIPALHVRTAKQPAPTMAPPEVAVFAMIDPDAKDDWGHFLAYDKRIAEACYDLNTDFALICRRELEPKFFPDSANLVLPVLTVHSWTVGKDWPRTRRREVMKFAKELDEAFATLEERYPEGGICVFMYVGCVEAAEAIEHLLIHRPRIRAVINLFWSYNFDEKIPDYRAAWERTMRRLSASGQVRILHATPQVAADYRVHWGIDLPVLLHPSTTFDDAKAAKLALSPTRSSLGSKRVLFPGGARKEKGFLLSVGACADLANDVALSCSLRARIDGVSGQELEDALNGLRAKKGATVEILSSDLSDAEFVSKIETADIVVIPYLAEAFRRRTSGILVDSLLLGKPVVVLKDTWLSDVVKDSHLGLCADPDPASLATAVREAARRYDEFLPGIAKTRRDYLGRHSWKALVTQAVQQAGLALPQPRRTPSKTEKAAMQKELKALISKLPTRAPIYLPTEKIPLEAQIKGLTRVKRIYESGLKDIYSPRLRALRAKYRGTKRCFVIGNGPSLNKTDLSLLKNEVTFAVNGFFLKTKDLDWKPTFYVVEDHLVAEDRAKWINAFKGPTKLFPAYLGYMFPEAEDTIFYNHRPRKSYPHGFDFSTCADEITYTGATVTFSMLQLAFYMGFEEIYMVGVDASYTIPADAKRASDYAVGVIDMQSDDINHFHPDYFGKGFRWHDPQVEKMIDAYREARRVVDGTSQRIYNATVGGQLEVFERRNFADLFAPKRPLDVMDYPRLLVLDMTAIGGGTATGEIKLNLLADWPHDRLLHIGQHRPAGLFASRGKNHDLVDQQHVSDAEADDLIGAFEPDVVLYRPVPDTPHLHTYAMKLLTNSCKPLISWIMDDWPRHLKSREPAEYEVMSRDLDIIMKRSAVRLTICQAMSEEMASRYCLPFRALANGIDPADWTTSKAHRAGPMLVRYAGGLADNMTRSSVLRIAKAVERLGQRGHDIRFEVNTRRAFYHTNLKEFGNFKFTRFSAQTLPNNDYRRWLVEADVSIIAYNFDTDSADYVRFSMANKMPECLASGSVVLAHGPKGLATIDYLNEMECSVVITEDSDESVEVALKTLQGDPALRAELAQKARATAFERHNVLRLREDLRQIVVFAAKRHDFEALPERLPHVVSPGSFAAANLLYRQKKYTEALKIYEALVAREPLEIYKVNAQFARAKCAGKKLTDSA